MEGQFDNKNGCHQPISFQEALDRRKNWHSFRETLHTSTIFAGGELHGGETYHPFNPRR